MADSVKSARKAFSPLLPKTFSNCLDFLYCTQHGTSSAVGSSFASKYSIIAQELTWRNQANPKSEGRNQPAPNYMKTTGTHH